MCHRRTELRSERCLPPAIINLSPARLDSSFGNSNLRRIDCDEHKTAAYWFNSHGLVVQRVSQRLAALPTPMRNVVLSHGERDTLSTPSLVIELFIPP
jgi:hypothetical protein